MDGSIIFHNEGGALFKMDICSNIEWSIDEPFHHSTEQGPDGNLWVPSVIEPVSFKFDKYTRHIRDHAITKVSLSGKILFRKIRSKNSDRKWLSGISFWIRQLF